VGSKPAGDMNFRVVCCREYKGCKGTQWMKRDREKKKTKSRQDQGRLSLVSVVRSQVEVFCVLCAVRGSFVSVLCNQVEVFCECCVQSEVLL
jgi:hypothetical protein